MADELLHYGEDYHFIPATSAANGVGVSVLPDLYCHTVQIVNICLVGRPDDGTFVLIDAGMPGSADDIISAVEDRFGSGSRPQAIILTHGHFDHVGALIELIREWNVPVYAHKDELPYLTGKTRYPEPDASVEGGLLAKISPFFPNEPIQLGDHVHPLPEDGTVPHLPEFRWLHTPGHTPGHISLFRPHDAALIAGDAFVTVRQDSLYKVLTQQTEITGPPRYYTTDWTAARESVRKLAALFPSVAVTGHGAPVAGEELRDGLTKLARDFDRIAVPDYGKYVH
ncbi:MBL fold metallo-hydrolase [Geobacillus stearothermophilus]|nr:MBL fold metallo-hydrolase [Geobacillus stearothermophilus]